MTQILEVVSQDAMFLVNKTDGTQMEKCSIVLQELGERPNRFAADMLGDVAKLTFQPGTLVVAVLQFYTHNYMNREKQDVTVRSIRAI